MRSIPWLALVAGCGGLPDGVELPTSERQDLAAVGLLGQRCSAIAIDVGGPDDAPAYALTAGHCTGFNQLLNPQIINYPEFISLGTLQFGLFSDAETTIDVETVERMYASMHGVDLGLYRLDATIGDLRALGVEPLPLADAPPPAGAPITIASYPHTTDGDERRVLHLSSCDEGGTFRLAEAGMVMIDFVENECKSIRPGSSGGAMLDEDGRVFAVVSTQSNTTHENHPLCSADHPCEVDSDPPVQHRYARYGAPLRALGACFVDGVFDLEAEGCSLTHPDLPVPEQPAGYVDRAAWNVTLREDVAYYRTKAGPSTEVRCEDDDGWGPLVATADEPVIDDPIPAGRPYVLCVQSASGPLPEPPARLLDHTSMLQLGP